MTGLKGDTLCQMWTGFRSAALSCFTAVTLLQNKFLKLYESMKKGQQIQATMVDQFYNHSLDKDAHSHETNSRNILLRISVLNTQ